jgi:hypothetical protein
MTKFQRLLPESLSIDQNPIRELSLYKHNPLRYFLPVALILSRYILALPYFPSGPPRYHTPFVKHNIGHPGDKARHPLQITTNFHGPSSLIGSRYSL